MDMTRQDLLTLIEEAFVNARYPGDDLVFMGRHSFESIAFLNDVSRRDWRNISSDFIRDNVEALSVIAIPAYPYFLPAYMTCALETSERSLVSDFVVYDLFAGGSPRETSFAKFECLSQPQKLVVLGFLRYVELRFAMQEATIAIRNYWGQFGTADVPNGAEATSSSRTLVVDERRVGDIVESCVLESLKKVAHPAETSTLQPPEMGTGIRHETD
jgi:hypothetical protein